MGADAGISLSPPIRGARLRFTGRGRYDAKEEAATAEKRPAAEEEEEEEEVEEVVDRRGEAVDKGDGGAAVWLMTSMTSLSLSSSADELT